MTIAGRTRGRRTITTRASAADHNRTGSGLHKVKRDDLMEDAARADMADELECEMCHSPNIRYKKWGYWCEACGHEHYIRQAEYDKHKLTQAEWDNKYR